MKWEQLRTYDETIRRNFAAGDFREALDTLVRGYQHVVVGFCTNMLGDTTLGEEVAQEVFLLRLPGYASVSRASVGADVVVCDRPQAMSEDIARPWTS